MEKFALGHACSIRDLFVNFPSNKVKLTKGKDYVFHKKQDIIDNNTQFKLPPVGNGSSYIQMKRFEGDEFKRLFKAGKWRDVDFLTSNFTGYQLAFYMNNKKRTDREKPIYISTKYRDQITEKTNQGFTY